MASVADRLDIEPMTLVVSSVVVILTGNSTTVETTTGLDRRKRAAVNGALDGSSCPVMAGGFYATARGGHGRFISTFWHIFLPPRSERRAALRASSRPHRLPVRLAGLEDVDRSTASGTKLPGGNILALDVVIADATVQRGSANRTEDFERGDASGT